jgi:hypothetical protein
MAPVAVLSQTVLTIPYAPLSPMRPIPDSDSVDLSSPPRRAPKERTPPVRTAFAFDTVESAVAAMARGDFVVVMDDEARENEGDLIIPAVGCSTEQMAWMIKHTRYRSPTPPPPRLRTHRTFDIANPITSSRFSLRHLRCLRPSVVVHLAGTSASRCRATVSRRSPSR